MLIGGELPLYPVSQSRVNRFLLPWRTRSNLDGIHSQIVFKNLYNKHRQSLRHILRKQFLSKCLTLASVINETLELAYGARYCAELSSRERERERVDPLPVYSLRKLKNHTAIALLGCC